jgi:tetratricopeptide (TPR) repeat protein
MTQPTPSGDFPLRPIEAQPAEPVAKTPRRMRLGRWMFLAALVVAAVAAWREAPREVARWHLASAMEHRLEADYRRWRGEAAAADEAQKKAEAALARAVAWNPADGAIYLARAEWREEDGRYEEALQDCELPGVAYDPLQLAHRKASLLIHLGRHRQAVAEAEKFFHISLSSVRQSRPFALNHIAYFRALANIDLPKALQEIDESFGDTPPQQRDEARLDTRGYILYRLGRYEEAIVDLDLAVERAELEIAGIHTLRDQRRKSALDPREFEVEEKRALAIHGVIYYHRALVLEKLNRWKEARQDYARAGELLGKPPDEHVF